MKKSITIAAAVSLGALATMATANAEDRWSSDQYANPSGPYVGAAWGRFDLRTRQLDAGGRTVTSISTSDTDAWKVFAGYRFAPFFAIEADYIDFGRASDRFTATGSNGNYNVDLSGFAPYAIGTLPLGPVELFGKIGWIYYDVDTRVNLDSPGPGQSAGIDTSHSRSDFTYGAGIGATFVEHLNVSLEYNVIDIENASNSNAIWLSAAWRF